MNEAYLNFSLLSSAKVSAASYQDRPDVRVAAVSNKYRVITVVLVEGHNTTTFSVNMTFGEGITKETVSFPYFSNLWISVNYLYFSCLIWYKALNLL